MLPHCGRCRLPQKNCVCRQLPSLALPFEIVVLRHEKASYKASNTAFVSSLCIQNLTMIDIDNPREVSQAIAPSSFDVLLFPPLEKKHIIDPQTYPKTIFVLDGSWKQARKMYRRNKILREIPHLSLSPRDIPPPRILTPSSPQGMSTMEAISRCCSYFGLEEESEALHQGLCAFIEQRRKVTGIQIPIPPGMSFSQVRKLGYG